MSRHARPVIDRGALRATVIRVVDESLDKGALSPDWIVDAVLELARPMPTRERLMRTLAAADGHVEERWEMPEFRAIAEPYWGVRADAVLALLNRDEP